MADRPPDGDQAHERASNRARQRTDERKPPEGYTDWLADLKGRIHTAQQCATLAVNRELVLLY